MSDRYDDYYAIIPHASHPAILLLQRENGWELPMATVALSPDDDRWRDAFRVNAAFLQVFGIELTVLRCLFVSPYPESGWHGSSVFVMSNHDAGWEKPLDGEWVGYHSLATLTFAQADHRALLLNYLKDMPGHDALPWSLDGWFEEASSWIHAQLYEQGLNATGPIEQVRSWFISAVLKTSTTSGDIYFKAVSAADVHEPVLTRMLGRQYPALVPQVLGIHENHRWLLTRAVAGGKMPRNGNVSDYLLRYKNLLRTYAWMQRSYLGNVEPFFTLGCHDWRLEVLIERIEPFFAELPVLLQSARHPLSKLEYDNLLRLVPRLKTACVELAGSGIPASLHHGDFHRGNIIFSEHAGNLLDWAGFVGVTHPFLSLRVPLTDWQEPERHLLCDAYLEEWSDYAPLEKLRRMVIQAHPLAELCGALGHRYQIKHARTALNWDMLGEQEHLLECLRSLLNLMR